MEQNEPEPEYEDLVAENALTAEEAAELAGLVNDLTGMMLSVTVEGGPDAAGLAERLAVRLRAGIGEPDARIQVEEGGSSAVLGPTRLDADDPAAAMALATAHLGGGSWTEPRTTPTAMGPVVHTVRTGHTGRPGLGGAGAPGDPGEAGPGGAATGEAGTGAVHLWAGCAYAFLAYAAAHGDAGSD